jgi:hypothetical protein
VSSHPRIKSTLFKALSTFAEAIDRTAQEHVGFSEVLSIEVADDLKVLERKKEETRKKVRVIFGRIQEKEKLILVLRNQHSSFYVKLVADRDQVYSSRVKVLSLQTADIETLI